MKIYLIGEIVHKNKSNIILESKGEGYLFTVPCEERFEVGQKTKLFIFNYRTEYSQNSYGFKDFKERLLFIDLISIEKIGPRIALNLLDKGWEYIAELIATDNVLELTKIPLVTEKMANLISVQLQEKWSKIYSNHAQKDNSKFQNQNDASDALLQLGFKKNQVDYALKQIRSSQMQFNNVDDLIEESIKIIATQASENATRTQTA
ncbi:Holliday junction branch migration protein RuvA [Mycoplasma nasistruthionis]|uniref:Holliday junction branch migration complex subunit RuvA n=1 Tax=Mycoplasma nasistruthionis TaxID=353852 RepID=A0A5B7XV17_9MOLU|nr:Holliday junction branch migration protein RuvA [Mycoplasma nasistruthionis]QCZ36527.1 Holliday junction branch migration protein RuvA [Mycoplasma nasistruthionis]